jgi:hypothetical protein
LLLRDQLLSDLAALRATSTVSSDSLVPLNMPEAGSLESGTIHDREDDHRLEEFRKRGKERERELEEREREVSRREQWAVEEMRWVIRWFKRDCIADRAGGIYRKLSDKVQYVEKDLSSWLSLMALQCASYRVDS